ncbi:MAG: hypothetical protein ACOVNZ_00355 [Crocinitomicaceae bacterium]
MTEIQLDVNIDDLRNIYFKENQQKYFFGPKTKKQSLYLILALIMYPFFVFYALNLKDNWLIVFGTIFFSLLIYDYWRVAKPIYSWKKSVERFLHESSKIKYLRFAYNDTYFIHSDDHKELKQNWELIEKATINDQLIWLYSDTDVLLPKKAMSSDEFQALSDLIFEKVKNVSKN